MKRHGLWQFHRALRQSQEPMQWWNPDEIERCSRFYKRISGNWLGGGFIETPYRRTDALIRCAYRYIRLYKLPKTQSVWNEVVNKIAKRGGMVWQSVKAASIDTNAYRKKSPLCWTDEFTVPSPRFSVLCVNMRHESLKKRQEARQAEIDKHCSICGKVHQGGAWLNLQLLGLDEVIPRINQYGRYRLCWSCSMYYAKLCKRAANADGMRLEINRQKRRMKNESTKDNAGTSGRTSPHHGWSDQRGCENG